MRYSQSIQSLKGIAALVVFLSHSIGFYEDSRVTTFYTTPFHLVTDGQCAVMLFFAITGFLTYRKDKSITEHTYINGIKRKCLRFFPQYIIVTIAAFILCNLQLSWDSALFTDWSNKFWTNTVGYKELIKQLILIYQTNWDLLNPPMWYMHVDMQMMFYLPLIVLLINQIGIWITIPFLLSSFFPEITPISYRFLAYYCIGMIMRYFVEKAKVRYLLEKKVWVVILTIGIIFVDIYNVRGVQEHIGGG